jgi:hypothetical protein
MAALPPVFHVPTDSLLETFPNEKICGWTKNSRTFCNPLSVVRNLADFSFKLAAEKAYRDMINILSEN